MESNKFNILQVIRLVTTKQRVNPYNRVGASDSDNDMTLGQKLALKYQISDKNKNQKETSIGNSEDSEGSDWTWETCSESEEETASTATTTTTATTTKGATTPVTNVTTPVSSSVITTAASSRATTPSVPSR